MRVHSSQRYIRGHPEQPLLVSYLWRVIDVSAGTSMAVPTRCSPDQRRATEQVYIAVHGAKAARQFGVHVLQIDKLLPEP